MIKQDKENKAILVEFNNHSIRDLNEYFEQGWSVAETIVERIAVEDAHPSYSPKKYSSQAIIILERTK